MALAAVLSAMRSIILDAPALPSDENARRNFYREQFPGLSECEAIDLAKMQPERLTIYTRSIFSGEAGILKNYFRMTVAAIERAYQRQGRLLKLRDFVQAMHKVFPWKTKTTEGLVESFERFLAHPASELGDQRELIRELAAFERQVFFARRLPLNEYEPGQGLRIDELRTRTVGDLLTLHWKLPTTTALGAFHWDIPSAQAAYKQSGNLPEMIDEREVRIIFSRDHENYVHWTQVPESVRLYLSSVERKDDSLGSLAEAFVTSCPTHSDEAKMFSDFLKLVETLLATGAIVLPR